MALIYDLVDMQELQGFARGIQEEAEENDFGLARFLPSVNIDEFEFRLDRGGELPDEDAAPFRSWDTEAPIGKRAGALERLIGELPPTSKKIRLGEEERLRRRALERGSNAQLIDAIYNDTAKMARAVVSRLELARGEGLWKARLDINENGVVQTVDFGRNPLLDQVAAIPWSDQANATPIFDMQAWILQYVEINDFRPGYTLMSENVHADLLVNEQIRNFAPSIANTIPDLVTEDTLDAIWRAFRLPPIVLHDGHVKVEGQRLRTIPEERILLLPPDGEPIGRTLWGTTAEALELVEAQQLSEDDAPGLVAVVEKTFDPVATWTKAAGIALPIMIEPDLVMSLQINPV